MVDDVAFVVANSLLGIAQIVVECFELLVLLFKNGIGAPAFGVGDGRLIARFCHRFNSPDDICQEFFVIGRTLIDFVNGGFIGSQFVKRRKNSGIDTRVINIRLPL